MPRILFVPVGLPAEILDKDPWAFAKEKLNNATLQMVYLDQRNIVVLCDEDGLDVLPLNREIPARMPEIPEGFEIINPSEMEHPAPGEMGVHRIHGDFVLARLPADDPEGDTPYVDLTDEDLRLFTTMLNDYWIPK